MLLTFDEGQQFFKLHRGLMWFVNDRLHVLDTQPLDPDNYSLLPGEARLKVRRALLQQPRLLEQFVADNPLHFSADDLEIVSSRRHQVAGEFILFRQLQKYAVFLGTDERPVAYGVLALAETFEEMLGPVLPIMTETVLLPFRDKIIYDSLLNSWNVYFGPGMRRGFNESYKEAKEDPGIVTRLPAGPIAGAPSSSRTTTSKPRRPAHRKR